MSKSAKIRRERAAILERVSNGEPHGVKDCWNCPFWRWVNVAHDNYPTCLHPSLPDGREMIAEDEDGCAIEDVDTLGDGYRMEWCPLETEPLILAQRSER